LLAQCLPGLLPQDRGGVSALSEKDLQLPTPAVEIIPSKTVAHHRYSGENLDALGLQVFKVLQMQFLNIVHHLQAVRK
jgi:hypothetical protein